MKIYKNKMSIQTSESIKLATFLSMSGGLMDAYSYMGRGHVFANAQTGNIILLGISITNHHYENILTYLFPVIFFAVGIAVADIIRHIFVYFYSKPFFIENELNNIFHWRQCIVLFEILILVYVSYLPYNMNLLANSLTSFACGMQVEAFRKIWGNGAATTMCIGNLRSATENLITFLIKKNFKYLKNSFIYLYVILCFTIGAITGDFLVRHLGLISIRASSLLLLVGFFIMFFHDRENNEPATK